jgi:hypothetical protein
MRNLKSLAYITVFLGICIQSFAQEAPSSALGTLGSLAMPHAGVPKHEGSWDRSGGNGDARPVEPGQTITLFDHIGAGIVRRFWVTIAPRAHKEIHRQAILRMYWDGSDTPAVECPIGDFFGVGFGEQKDYISLPLNETSGGYNCYWPMPFHSRAHWTLTNLSERKIDAFYYNIDYTAYEKVTDDVRLFHAQWRRENPTKPGENYTILEAEGAGHFVGVAMFMQGRRPRGLGFLEGDENIFIDGEDKPSINGTGTEDYFSSGWYFDRGTYSAPFHGCIIKDERLSRINAYRWHIEDAMPFKKSIRVTIEHGHAGAKPNDAEADYSSVAFYYLDRTNTKSPPLPKDAKDLLPIDPPQARKLPGVIEGEALLNSAKASGGELSIQYMDAFPGEWSDGAQLWWRPDKIGETLTINVPVERAGEYTIVGHFCRAPDYGQAKIQVGEAEPTSHDFYAETVTPSGPEPLGRATLKAGENKITITIAGKQEKSTGYLVGIDAIQLKAVK